MNIIDPRMGTLWTPGQKFDRIWPAGPAALDVPPVKGMEHIGLPELKALGFLPPVGGGAAPATNSGYHVTGDIVTQTADGRDLSTIWDDFLSMLNAVNAQRQALIRFLTFSVSQPVELVPQQGSGVDFEEASQFGEPVGQRVTPTYFNMGYTFKWYDLAGRYTWQYLADATAQMVESLGNAAVEAFWRKQLFEVFKTVFNAGNLSANINQQAYTVFKFYNNDGTVPPAYKNNTFLSTHTHYRTTGAATLDAGDLDEMIADFVSHGYSQETGYRQVLMVHTTLGNTIRAFRSIANGGTGVYDFIPAQGQPGQITAQTTQVIGQTPVAPTLDGLTVIGNYGPLIIVTDDWLPTTHIFGFTTGGADNLGNPIGIREHPQANLQGLRLVKGRQPDYPLIDSFWAFGFGTGVRHRGAGMVMEITADATYDPPAIYA
jgi:hypothetical protein